MVKREKVIKGLECCLGIRNICLDNPECPYNDCEDRACGDGCMSFMMRDALALLKAREAVEPVPAMDDGWECGACGGGVVGYEDLDVSGFVEVKHNFCPNCGRAVKWE